MARRLLLRGMLTGIIAGLVVFVFARWIGEPQVETAITFEAKADQAKGEIPEPEIVSRKVQRGAGLLVGTVVYGTAIGGLFSLVFAVSYGRVGIADPRGLSMLLAALGFIAIVFVPTLKYPANPPSVGLPETISMRTSLYFAMILISLAAMIAAGMLRNRLTPRFGGWSSALIAAAAYIAVMAGVASALPGVNEVPEDFPATVLWQFRIASLGGQLIMWTTLGLIFGVAAERLLAPRRSTA
jgi:predicted cobalt transporter CbtA